jgi:hypothetical protein
MFMVKASCLREGRKKVCKCVCVCECVCVCVCVCVWKGMRTRGKEESACHALKENSPPPIIPLLFRSASAPQPWPHETREKVVGREGGERPYLVLMFAMLTTEGVDLL